MFVIGIHCGAPPSCFRYVYHSADHTTTFNFLRPHPESNRITNLRRVGGESVSGGLLGWDPLARREVAVAVSVSRGSHPLDCLSVLCLQELETLVHPEGVEPSPPSCEDGYSP